MLCFFHGNTVEYTYLQGSESIPQAGRHFALHDSSDGRGCRGEMRKFCRACETGVTYMKFLNNNNLKKPWAAYTFAICCGVILYLFLSHFNIVWYGLGRLADFVRPVFIGLVIAYILNPLVRLIRRSLFRGIQSERIAWPISVAVGEIAVIFGIVILLVALIPQIFHSIQTLINNVGMYAKSISDLLKNLNSAASQANLDITDLTTMGQDIVNQVTKYLSRNSGDVLSTVTGTISGIINGGISFIISIYFLLDKGHLLKGCSELNHLVISEKAYPNVADFWNRCNNILGRYIWCDLLDGLIIGCANAVFMLLGGMPYVALISVVVGVTNLAPTFGPIVGGAIGAFILVLNNPWDALWFLIFTIVLQTIDGYIIKPKLFGGVLNVPGIWILIMIIIGGRMFGVVGILLAIPAAAILNYIYHDYVLVRLKEARRQRSRAGAQTTGAAEDAPAGTESE